MICARCGTNNSAEYSYCLRCGSPLPVSQQQPTHLLDESTSSQQPQASPRADSYGGRTLDGKYRLENKLGEGGMGFVYLATRLHIGDHVAVKVLHGDKRNDLQAGERFRLEAQTAARLKHPNAVGVYDYGVTEDGLRYLVMELVEGRSLRQIIAQQGPLPLPAVAEVNSQICAALSEAHRQGIVHRDIKPDNIIVQDTPAGLRIKVLDFGIAKLRDLTASNLTKPGHVMGTPRYMSPEHCMGEELDGRSDIYSLGVVLYEMLCGIVPFTAPTSTAVAVQQVTQAPPPLRRINSFVPPAVEAVVMHALEKRPEARPHTATVFAQELVAAIHGRPISQPTTLAMPVGGTLPMTGASIPLSTSDNQPTMATIPSLSGSREVIPPNYLVNSGGAAKNYSKKSRWPLLLATLVLLAGIGVGAYLLLSGRPASIATGQAETAAQSNANRPSDNLNRQAAPVGTPSPATTTTTTASVDDELDRLRTRRIDATPAQYHDVQQALEEAAQKHPTDYRFSYELAKLVLQTPQHHEAFHALSEAGRRAIRNGQAARMLNDLARDSDGEFRRLSHGHHEWEALEDALRRQDESALPEPEEH